LRAFLVQNACVLMSRSLAFIFASQVFPLPKGLRPPSPLRSGTPGWRHFLAFLQDCSRIGKTLDGLLKRPRDIPKKAWSSFRHRTPKIAPDGSRFSWTFSWVAGFPFPFPKSLFRESTIEFLKERFSRSSFLLFLLTWKNFKDRFFSIFSYQEIVQIIEILSPRFSEAMIFPCFPLSLSF